MYPAHEISLILLSQIIEEIEIFQMFRLDIRSVGKIFINLIQAHFRNFIALLYHSWPPDNLIIGRFAVP